MRDLITILFLIQILIMGLFIFGEIKYKFKKWQVERLKKVWRNK